MTAPIGRFVNELVVDVSTYQNGGPVFSKPLHLIVKSLDQVERRSRLIESKQRGRIGRIESREIETGLWVRLSLSHDVRRRGGAHDAVPDLGREPSHAG